MVESGGKIVLDRDVNGKPCSYVEHEATGKRTIICEPNGTFQFNIRAPRVGATDANRVQEVNEKIENEGFQRPGAFEADLFY